MVVQELASTFRSNETPLNMGRIFRCRLQGWCMRPEVPELTLWRCLTDDDLLGNPRVTGHSTGACRSRGFGSRGGPDIALDVWVTKEQEVLKDERLTRSLLLLHNSDAQSSVWATPPIRATGELPQVQGSQEIDTCQFSGILNVFHSENHKVRRDHRPYEHAMPKL